MNKALDLQIALPAGSLEAYIHSVNRVPMLSATEERSLATRFSETGDLDAARRLVTSHLRFVVRVARGYSGYGLAQADLIQEGNIGLMKAVKRFDPGVGVRLVSFAVHWIRAEIHEFILKNWRIVKIATTKSQRKLFFNLRSARKRLGWMNHGEVQAVARDLGVSPGDVLEMEKRMSAYDASFDGPVAGHDENREFHSPAAFLQDGREDPEHLVEAAQDERLVLGKLADSLKALDGRSKAIITQRWLNEEKKTLHELAGEYGISAERVRQLEQSALKKLRASLS